MILNSGLFPVLLTRLFEPQGDTTMGQPSDVARIRQQILAEYQSAQYVFTGFTPTAKHEYLTQRQERLAEHFECLKKHLPPDEAMKVFIQACKRTIDYRRIHVGSVVAYHMRADQLPTYPQKEWHAKIIDISMNADQTKGVACVEGIEPEYEGCTEHIFLSQIVRIIDA